MIGIVMKFSYAIVEVERTDWLGCMENVHFNWSIGKGCTVRFIKPP